MDLRDIAATYFQILSDIDELDHVGQTVQLTTQIIPSYASEQGVTWQSDDPETLSVSSDGLVTVKKAFDKTIHIYAKSSSGLSDSISFWYHRKYNNIITSNITKTYSTKTQIFKLGAKSHDGAPMTYSSNNKYIAINSSGTVTVKSKYIGSATILIKTPQTDNYESDWKKTTITVNPSKTTFSSASNIKGKKIKVKWKKNTCGTGYQIQYSTSSKFASKNKTVTIKKNKTVTATISKLTKGKTYYVRIRTYKTVSGKNYYSGWSTVKKVKIKR